MTVAFDAFSQDNAASVSHTPVGTPAGIVAAVRNFGEITDASPTYGGVAMTEMTGSPVFFDVVDTYLHLYFLGSGIPTGTQTFAVNGTTSFRHTGVWSVTASGDTEVQTTAKFADSTGSGDVTGTISPAGTDCWIGEIGESGADATGLIDPLTGWTLRYEEDEGTSNIFWYDRDSNSSTDVSFGVNHNTGSETASCIAFAIKEAAGGATAALTGVSGTGQVGTLSFVISPTIAITGVAGTGQVGSLTALPETITALTGLEGTGQLGTLTVDIVEGTTVLLTGVSGQGVVGDLGLAIDATLTLTGVEGTGFVGTLTATVPASETAALTGAQAAGQAGTITVSVTGLWTPVTPDSNTWTLQSVGSATWSTVTPSTTTWEDV